MKFRQGVGYMECIRANGLRVFSIHDDGRIVVRDQRSDSHKDFCLQFRKGELESMLLSMMNLQSKNLGFTKTDIAFAKVQIFKARRSIGIMFIGHVKKDKACIDVWIEERVSASFVRAAWQKLFAKKARAA